MAALRRKWAHRWRAATGRSAVSLQAQRAWQLAAIAGLGAALVTIVGGPDRPAAPAPVFSSLPPASQVVPPPTPPPVAQVTDRVTKVRARRLARRLEQCHRINRTFFGCADVAAPDIGPSVTIAELTADRFVIVARASSGSVFTIVRDERMTVRPCTTAGVRGCPSTGRW